MYDWTGKESECYKMYVEENKSIDEVMQYWQERGFTPSKRVFHTQFRRWNFPGKHKPAHKNPALIARVQELWGRNYSQKDMGDTLLNEGFEINNRELTRLRLRFGLLLRERKGEGEEAKSERHKRPEKQKLGDRQGVVDHIVNSILQTSSSGSEASDENVPQSAPPLETANISAHAASSINPTELLHKTLKKQQLQNESDEKWRTRKRRRRTRGWAGLPADAAGEPPRFPSETTLDESRAYLLLDKKLYKEVRDQFEAICLEKDVRKKTVAGPELWSQIIQQLVTENTHLSTFLLGQVNSVQQSNSNWNSKDQAMLSLDVICQDVTKRLRTMGTKMTLLEAKSVLKLNPEEYRQVREEFLGLLRAEGVSRKFEIDKQRWLELNQQWVKESKYLSAVAASAYSQYGPQDVIKVKAIQILARDTMKRLRTENVDKRANEAQQARKRSRVPLTTSQASSGLGGPSITRETNVRNADSIHMSDSGTACLFDADRQIDPSLLLAASDAAVAPQAFTHANQLVHQQTRSDGSVESPIPIYFRLHGQSHTPYPHKTTWLSILKTCTVDAVKTLATLGHPGTVVVRLDGIVPFKSSANGTNEELMIAIDTNTELTAYFEHVGNGKTTFLVLLGLSAGG